jgi:uncharacterized membrane protein
MYAVGMVAGVCASLLFNVGIALQALEARAAPAEQGLRVSLLTHLIKRRRWLIGLLLGGLGVPLEILAFAEAPFVVVEPILAVGLLVLLALGVRVLGETVQVTALLGVIAIIGGTVLVAWGAPTHSEAHRGAVAVVGVMAALVLASLVPFPLRGTRFDRALVPNLASACGFAATNVATKLMGDNLNRGHYANFALWLVVALMTGVVATLTGMTALQRREATVVVPISTAVQTFLPIALEPLFLQERLSTAELGGSVLLAGLVVMVIGTVLVSRTRAVSTLVAGEQPGGAT